MIVVNASPNCRAQLSHTCRDDILWPGSRGAGMRRRAVLGGIGASVTVAGCDAPARLASLPPKLRATASFQSLPAGARITLDGTDDELMGRMAMDALRRELA